MSTRSPVPRPAPEPVRSGRPCSRYRREGFSLIEIVAALTFLVISLVGISTLFVSSQRSSETAWEQSRLVHEFRYLSELIRSTPFRDIADVYSGYVHTVPELGVQCQVIVHLDETAAGPEPSKLGLPRDLDGDGVAETTDVRANYILLPLTIRATRTDTGAFVADHHFLLSQEE